jgi:isopentenyl diphosphate isomerase/L-lactate dehydrogenase-like FMN-dependent dehydrogenase
VLNTWSVVMSRGARAELLDRRDVQAALGADAVAVGRPVWWSLALGGAGGVNGLMAYFQRELVDTMLRCGVNDIASLGRDHVERAGG